MVPRLNRNALMVAAFGLLSFAVLSPLPSQVAAGPIALSPIADDTPYDDGAGANSENDPDQPAQRAPDAEEPSEDGTDGADGGNSAEPPPGCMFRDGPLELVV